METNNKKSELSTNIKYKYTIWTKDGEELKKSYKKHDKNNHEKKEINLTKEEIFDYRSFNKDKEKTQNDKEIFNERLVGRDKLIQTSINPFLSSCDYINDIATQDKFLRPKNSSYKE